MKTLEMIVPCFNEEEVIDKFYETVSPILNSIEGFDCSMIFVDDGSKDRTLELIKKLASDDEKVKYITFSRNFGKEGAMLAGLTFSSADYVGIIDADLQHSPELIPEMLKAVTEEDYDVAAAKRSDRNGEAKIKSFLSASFYKVSNSFSDVKIDDGAQDFRIMKRKVVDSIVALSEKNRFTKGIFSFVGFKTKWFPHENSERAGGTSKWNILKLFKYAMNGIFAYTNAPLKIPTFFGIVCVLLSAIYGVILLIEPVGVRVTATRMILTGVFFIGGLILMCLGIVGEYLARIYTEVKNRPTYIVSETNITK